MSTTEHDLATKSKSRSKKPRRFTVVMVNDDFTTMDFVILVLTQILGQSVEQAEKLTMEIHEKGRAAAGIFTLEIAESKASQIMNLARHYDFPFRCAVEAV